MSQANTNQKPAVETLEVTAPEYWASYLINGDDSGFDSDMDEVACKRFEMEWEHEGYRFVSCSDEASFIRNHDAKKYSPFAANCLTFTLIRC